MCLTEDCSLTLTPRLDTTKHLVELGPILIPQNRDWSGQRVRDRWYSGWCLVFRIFTLDLLLDMLIFTVQEATLNIFDTNVEGAKVYVKCEYFHS